ncbi:MAG TPA: hypothetical protein DCQ31_07190 [Bacteroidales bacterium]|nr:hypothetical protein [Bacteroidales bacterium]
MLMLNKISACIFFLTLGISSVIWAQPENYKGIPAEYYTTVLLDNFDEKENFFSEGTAGQSVGKTENGLYSWSSLTNQAMFSFYEISGYSSKDFEFETSMKYSKGKNNAFNGLIIGNGTGDFFYFGFTGKGEFAVLQYRDSVEMLKPFSDSDLVNKKGFNKITVRKIDKTIYYFLNEQLMYEFDLPRFVPAQFGFLVAENSTIESEYIRYSEIEKSFYTVERVWNALKLNGIKPENKTPLLFNFTNLLPDSLKPIEKSATGLPIIHAKSTQYAVNAPLLDSTKNYEIEVQIAWLDSTTTEFSFFWCSSDSLYNQMILLPLAGMTRINTGKKLKSDKTSLIPCSSLKSDEPNTLLIRKVDNAMYIFINFELISIQKSLPFYGNKIGFFVQPKSKFELELLQISQLNLPEIYLRKR